MERVAFVMHVKKGQEAEYVRRHREVWPQVLADLERAGVEQMNIFMTGRELFYMEVDDYAEAARILGECPESVPGSVYGTHYGRRRRAIQILKILSTVCPKSSEQRSVNYGRIEDKWL